jgi:hypothetical protein
VTVPQQINLYQAGTKSERVPFSAAFVAWASAAVLILFLGVYGYELWRSAAIEADVARLTAKREEAVKHLAQVQQTVPQRTKSALLASEIARREVELARVREVVATLSGRGDGYAAGFSQYLEGLARQRVEGLWLTGFRIVNGGKGLELRGKALSPELVPVLVQRLGEEAVFAGLSFSVLKLERPADGPAAVSFTLTTKMTAEQTG